MAGQHGLMIGVDVGGTFTDAVVIDGSGGKLLDAFKLPSTGDDPSKGIRAVLERIAKSETLDGAQLFHGTTVGTNALIERKGASLALVSTAGFSDVVELRRQDRPTLYDLDVRVSEPLADRDRRFELEERMGPDGLVLRQPANLDELAARLKESGVEAVAVTLLHAYANGAHERAVRDAIAAVLPDAYVTLSHEVCPELGEYERASTTMVNAYIGPPVSRYMHRLADFAKEASIDTVRIVKSNGGVTAPENAATYPAHLIESGPAAGMIAAAAFAQSTGQPDLIAFDMGGTTAKAGVILAGEPRTTNEFRADRLIEGRDFGGYLIRSAVLDIVEIGAGGGSIARLDEAGALKVGPTSAGAYPGPACYSRGGTLPTVTDAHAVIGSLSQHVFEDGVVRFSRDLAVEAISQHIAKPLGWSVGRAAYAIIDLAIAHMADMVRLATVRRGLDPRDFSMLASGGAGPLHAAAVGAEVGVSRTIIPPLPGMFSALGATLGEVRHDLSQATLQLLAGVDPALLDVTFELLQDRAKALLDREAGHGRREPKLARFADLRFAGQLFELSVPLGHADEALPNRGEIERDFREVYRVEFGFDLERSEVQLVRLRLVATLPRETRTEVLFQLHDASGTPRELRLQPLLDRNGSELMVPVFSIEDGGNVQGPALIELAGSTVWLHKGQSASFYQGGAVEIIQAGAK